MRCVDVRREWSSGLRAPESVAHVATCSECRVFVDSIGAFDQLWTASRPETPPEAAWDALWRRVEQATAAADGPRPILRLADRDPARLRRRVRAINLAICATAAAAALMFTLSLRLKSNLVKNLPQVAQTSPQTPAARPAPSVFDIDEGQTIVIRVDDAGRRVVDLAAADDFGNAVDPNFMMFDHFESLADWPRLVPSTSELPGGKDVQISLAVALTGLVVLDDVAPAAGFGDDARQATLFGILVTPGSSEIDPNLARIEPQLRKLFPNFGFKLLDVQGRRLTRGDSLTSEFEGGYAVSTRLASPLDDEGKLELRLTMSRGEATLLDSKINTPLNQLFFCEKTLDHGARLLVGIGAR